MYGHSLADVKKRKKNGEYQTDDLLRNAFPYTQRQCQLDWKPLQAFLRSEKSIVTVKLLPHVKIALLWDLTLMFLVLC